MKVILTRLSTFFLFLSFFYISGCATATLDQVLVGNHVAQLNEMNSVTIKRENKPLVIKSNMTLQQKDLFETGPDATAIILFSDKAKVFVREDTLLAIGNPSVRLHRGEIFIQKLKDIFGVNTEYVKAAATGTEFVVEKDLFGEIIVTVIEGLVTLNSPKNLWSPVRLHPKMRATVPVNGKPQTHNLNNNQLNSIIEWINAIGRYQGKGAGTVIVPDITGRSEAVGIPLLADASLVVGERKKIITGKYAVGTVTAQKPHGYSRLALNGRVDISVESKSSIVPKLIGKQELSAASMLAKENLKLGNVNRQITGHYPPHTITGQSPKEGKQVFEGTAVDITVEAVSVPVPKLISLPLSQARTILNQSRLSTGKVNMVITGRLPAGAVVQQNPAAGKRVMEGTTVYLTVEEESVKVPRLTGLSKYEAVSLLSQMNLVQGQLTERITGKAQPGIVIEQAPAAGSLVRLQEQVSIVVEAPSVLLPYFVNKHINYVAQELQRLGLSMNKQEKITGRHQAGVVIDQSPGANTRLAPGSRVFLTVEAPSVLVPSLVNRHINSAAQEVQHLGLSVIRQERITGRQRPGYVIEQHPQANTRLALGKQITLVVEGDSVKVPNYVGMDANSAARNIASRGLVLRRIDKRCSGHQRTGTVLSQDPHPGMVVKRGSGIALVAEDDKISVPNMIRLSQQSAVTRLRQAGLGGGPNIRTGNKQGYPNGSVIEQSPPAGTRVCRGSSVTLVIQKTIYQMQPIQPLPVFPPMHQIPAQPSKITVPGVIGLYQQQATDRLKAVGLTVGPTRSGNRIGFQPMQVIEQNPPAGTRVVKGTSVTLIIQAIR